jgi:hypothetical protein
MADPIVFFVLKFDHLALSDDNHGRMGRGAWDGPPPKFYGRAKITAKFGQNIKISEKL